MEAAVRVASDATILPYRQTQGRERGRFLRTPADYARHIGYLAMLRDAEQQRLENKTLGYHRPGLDDPIPGLDGEATLAEVLLSERVENARLWRARDAEPTEEDIVERDILPENARLWGVFMDLVEQADRPTGMTVEFAVLREWPYGLLEKRFQAEMDEAECARALPAGWLRHGDVCDAVIRYAELARSRPSKWIELRRELRERFPQWRRDARRRREVEVSGLG